MNAIMVAMLSGMLAGQISAEDLELKIVFDQTTIALGDMAYCEVQLWNRSERVLTLTEPAPPHNLQFEVNVAGTAYKPAIGGDLAGGFPRHRTDPGTCIAVREQVLFWNHEIVTEHEQEKFLTVTASLRIKPGVVVSSQPVAIRIDGSVASRDLLLKLYATYEEQRKRLEQAGSLERHYRTIYSVGVSEIVLQERIARTVLDQLADGLRLGSALYRKVSIARLLHEYMSHDDMEYEELERHLLKILAKCGPAERQWLLKRTGAGLEVRGKPLEAQRLYEMDLDKRLFELAF